MKYYHINLLDSQNNRRVVLNYLLIQKPANKKMIPKTSVPMK